MIIKRLDVSDNCSVIIILLVNLILDELGLLFFFFVSKIHGMILRGI